MDVLNMCHRMEYLARSINERIAPSADQFRLNPYSSVESVLTYLSADMPLLSTRIDKFLADHHGMIDSSMQVLKTDGYDLDKMFLEYDSIISEYIGEVPV